jgi:hypothetical protein
VHESIGREEDPASAKLGGSSKDGADDAPTIEYTSFGGPARITTKSRAEQMAAERRVRTTQKKIPLLSLFSIEKKHFKLNSCSLPGLFFFQLRQIAASQRRGSGTDSNEAVEDRPKVYILFPYGSLQSQNSEILRFFFSRNGSARFATNISDAC